MTKKFTEKELIDLLVDYILKNSDSMPSTNLFEKCLLKTYEITEKVEKLLHKKLRE